MASFAPMLMEGVELETDLGCSVFELLCDQIGLDVAYVNSRIQTVFMDGSPVDRLEDTLVRHGSVLALSAALPGLLGATLRKDGVYASLRQGITHMAPPAPGDRGRGLFTIKVFNVLLRELATPVFRFGVIVIWKRLDTRIRKGGDPLMNSIQAAEIDGNPSTAKDVAALGWPAESRVFFSFNVNTLGPPS